MALRVLKGLSENDDSITALHWGKLGLAAGSVMGDIFVWPKDISINGGLCHLGDSQTYHNHTMAITSLSSLGNSVISISLDESIFATEIVNPLTSPDFETSGLKTGQRILTEIKEPFGIQTIEKLGLIFISTLQGYVYVADRNYNIKSKSQILNSEIISLSVHESSNRGVVIGTKELIMFDLTTLEILKRLTITADNCNCVCFSTDGLSILVTTTEGTLRIVDSVSFKEVGCQKFDIGELNDVMPINYGKRYIIAGSEGKVGLFNLNKMIKELGLKVSSGMMKCVAVQDEDMKIAVAGSDNMINLLDFD